MFRGKVENSGIWRDREGSQEFVGLFTNKPGAEYYVSLDGAVGSIFHGNVINYGQFNAGDMGKLVFLADWNNQGTFNPESGMVYLSGSGVQNILSGTGWIEFASIQIGSGSQVVLQNNLHVLQI